MKRIKKDDKGFTLVELIIAVVIIAIVMTPFIRNFTESTRLNSKAKDAMDATNMASNVMEGLNAYTAEEIILAFNSVDDRGELAILPNEVSTIGYGEINTTGTNWEKGFSVAGSDPTADVDYSGSSYAIPLSGGDDATPIMDNLKLKPSADKKYYFYAEGIEQRRGTYDIAVVLDASSDSGYTGTDGDGNGKVDESEQRYNDYASAKLTSINGLFDRIYQENANLRDEVLIDFYNEQTGNNKVGTDKMEKIMSRTMAIDIEYQAGSTDVVLVRCTESFSLPWNTVNVGGQSITMNQCYNGNTRGWHAGNLPTISEPPVLVFDSSEYNQMPRNIYVYYYGNYASSTANYLDNIEINNTADIDINIHLIRIASDDTTDATEAGYASRLYVNEDVSNGYNTTITSNLRDNITKSNADNATNRTTRSRCPFYLNGFEISSDADVAYTSIVNENGGVETEVTDRLYSVTMYVYEEGAAASGFPDDMLVTTFEGSANQ